LFSAWDNSVVGILPRFLTESEILTVPCQARITRLTGFPIRLRIVLHQRYYVLINSSVCLDRHRFEAEKTSVARIRFYDRTEFVFSVLFHIYLLLVLFSNGSVAHPLFSIFFYLLPKMRSILVLSAPLWRDLLSTLSPLHFLS
jgi:hypothetical protein